MIDYDSKNYVVEHVFEEVTNFFYVKVPQAETSFKPFENVTMEANSLKYPGVVLIDGNLSSGVGISSEMANNLGVTKGDILTIKTLYHVLPIQNILLKKISGEPIKKSYTKFRISQMLLENLKYSFIGNGYQTTINGVTYELRIRDTNKLMGQVIPTTFFFYLEDSKVELNSGQQKVLMLLSQILEWPKYYSQYFKELDIEIPKGVLLHGPPGTGKTHLLREVINSSKWKVFTIKGPELISKYVGGSQSALRKVFQNAKVDQPSIILIDQIDSIASKRGSGAEYESKLVSQLLSCMDGITDRGKVIVFATTNNLNNLDPALRRPGRFDKEVAVLPPNIEDRRMLLEVFLQNTKTSELDLDELAHRTNGYVHADLKLLCNEAKLNLIDRNMQQECRPVLQMVDFFTALKNIAPSLLREYNLPNFTKQKVYLDDVIGYDKIKKQLTKELTYPVRYEKIYEAKKIKPIRGLIISGPPGTGKTTLAKALANQMNYNFLFISGSELLSKWVGETESKISDLFQKARMTQPCIIFIDQIDSLFGNARDESQQNNEISKLGTFLSNMDGLTLNKENIFLIGTTNRLDMLDPALLRAGRFELKLTMDYPTKDELLALMNHYFKFDTDWAPLVNYAHKHKFTGADVSAYKRLFISNTIERSSVDQIKQYPENMVYDPELLMHTLKEYIVLRKENVDTTHAY